MPASTQHFARAIVYVLVAILLFDLQGVIIKFLGDRYPVQQLAGFRNVFGLILGLTTVVFTVTMSAITVVWRYYFSRR